MRGVRPIMVPASLERWHLVYIDGPVWTFYERRRPRPAESPTGGCVQIAFFVPTVPAHVPGGREVRITRYLSAPPDARPTGVLWSVSVFVYAGSMPERNQIQLAHDAMRSASHLRLVFLSRRHDGWRG